MRPGVQIANFILNPSQIELEALICRTDCVCVCVSLEVLKS